MLRRVFSSLKSLQTWAEQDQEVRAPQKKNRVNENGGETRTVNLGGAEGKKQYKVINVWKYLTFKEGTQAHHLTKVLDFEEWVWMEEILRRVNELFGVTYQNVRSLYPYLKTLVDTGLLEANMLGGKMRWRKKSLLQTIELLEEEEAILATPPTQ